MALALPWLKKTIIYFYRSVNLWLYISALYSSLILVLTLINTVNPPFNGLIGVIGWPVMVTSGWRKDYFDMVVATMNNCVTKKLCPSFPNLTQQILFHISKVHYMGGFTVFQSLFDWILPVVIHIRVLFMKEYTSNSFNNVNFYKVYFLFYPSISQEASVSQCDSLWI